MGQYNIAQESNFHMKKEALWFFFSYFSNDEPDMINGIKTQNLLNNNKH